MKINQSTMKMWSRIGSRATFGVVALELGATIDDLMILTADVSTSAGLDRFKKTFPEKYLDVGIAEQNLIGIAAGLSSEGITTITTTFAPFQTMRCCEQIRVNLGYMSQNVCMVGLASGLVLGTLGYTHCCIEDLSVMRSIPGIVVISPADCGATGKAILAAVNHPQPTYIRLTGSTNNPIVYSDDFEYRIGKANIIARELDPDITIFATGTMVHASIEAEKLLRQKGVSVTIVDMHTIKPLDIDTIDKVCESTKLIVSVEEHSVIGGLGSAICEHKSKTKCSPPQLIIGLPDKYGKGGEYRDLLAEYGLTPKAIANKIELEYRNIH